MKEEANDDILALARAIHSRLQELEAGGLKIEVTRNVEELLLNDPSYVRRLPRTRRNSNPALKAVEDAARMLRTRVSALVGEQPHPAVYTAPPSSEEDDRRRIHQEGGGDATPFTMLLFAPEGDTQAVAIIAEYPVAQAFGETEAEAIEALREAVDILLIRTYENTVHRIDTRGRAFVQAPFHFHPPAAERTR